MNTKLNKILTAFLIAILALGTLTGCSGDSEKNADKPKKDYSNIEMNPNISIPGFESLEFKAGKTKQSVDFYEKAKGLSIPVNTISDEMLQSALDKAIKDENYEMASHLRDEINRRKTRK
jgi:hypothetical protein